MPHASSQAFTDHLQTLFGAGTCAGLSDGELIERFRTGQDEGSEHAFEALVTRHGPMVLGVCRNILSDPVDVHDAFQATFLVLARRANAIRNRGAVGSWLYGVALRVAARGRVSSIRRQIRNRRSIAAAGAGSPELSLVASIERDDAAATVHQEVNRLPEKYRAPVVLCYLEGLSHVEAAAQLSWPVGTVRSRLARARDRLRSRLTRRGVTSASALGPLAPFFLSDAAASTAAASPLPAHLATSVARLATRLTIGQTATAGLLPAAALELAQGVLTTMIIKKSIIACCAVLALGIAAAGGGALVIRPSRAQDPAPGPAGTPTSIPAPPAAQAAKPVGIDPQLEMLIAAARARVEAQKAYYEEGRITVDRFIDGLERLQRILLIAAKTDPERIEIRERHLRWLAEIENREDNEIKVGRGTTADLSEARQRHLEAKYEMKNANKEAAEKSAILRRLSELERKVDGLQKERVEIPAAGAR
jgi:RNA polymerase sigma factor (sigma-70 family)